jgi:hypothetical protein
VAVDPRNLAPVQLCRLLNSTPLGEVISERQLHRHRTRAGFRIGEGRTVDLLRYTAWLEGLPSLLPETDYVMLIRKDSGVAASGRLEDVRRIVGDQMAEDPEFYPTRYFVSGFPTEAQLQQIGEQLKGT